MGLLSQRSMDMLSSRSSIWRTQSVKLTANSDVNDSKVKRYLCQEMLLNISLVLTTMVSFVLFALALWMRHFVVNFLSHYLQDSVEQIKTELKLANPNKTTAYVKARLPPLIEQDDTGVVYVGAWVRVLSDLLMTIILLLWTTTIAGVLSIYEKNRVFVIAFIVSNITNVFSQIGFVGLLHSRDDSMHDGMRDQMTLILQQHYSFHSTSLLSKIVNTVMAAGKCCGINGPDDFRMQTGSGAFQLPPPCCKMETWGVYNQSSPTGHKYCLVTASKKNDVYYKRGCFDVWQDYFTDANNSLIVTSTIIMCVLQLIQACIGGIILKWTAFAIKLDIEDDDEDSDSNSQRWVSGLRVTTASEINAANARFKYGSTNSHSI